MGHAIVALAVYLAVRLQLPSAPKGSAESRSEIRQRIQEWGTSTLSTVRDRYFLPVDGVPSPDEFPDSRLVKEFKFPDDRVILVNLQMQIRIYCNLAEGGLPGKNRGDLVEELHQASWRGEEGEGYQL